MTATTWRAITWNLNWWQSGERQVEPELVIERYRPDIALLQEVKGSSLRDNHLGPSVSSQDEYGPANWGWMGCAILLQPGAEVLASGVVETLPKPQRSVWARVAMPSGLELTAVSWHTPNRAGDGLATKMSAYAAMTDWLQTAPRPLVVGADLNTWTDPIDLESPSADEEHFEENSFVGINARHGLVDAYRVVLEASGELEARRRAEADGPLAVSYVLSSGAEHRMDRIFASPDLAPHDGGYVMDEARAAGSDHALHWIGGPPV